MSGTKTALGGRRGEQLLHRLATAVLVSTVSTCQGLLILFGNKVRTASLHMRYVSITTVTKCHLSLPTMGFPINTSSWDLLDEQIRFQNNGPAVVRFDWQAKTTFITYHATPTKAHETIAPVLDKLVLVYYYYCCWAGVGRGPRGKKEKEKKRPEVLYGSPGAGRAVERLGLAVRGVQEKVSSLTGTLFCTTWNQVTLSRTGAVVLHTCAMENSGGRKKRTPITTRAPV